MTTTTWQINDWNWLRHISPTWALTVRYHTVFLLGWLQCYRSELPFSILLFSIISALDFTLDLTASIHSLQSQPTTTSTPRQFLYYRLNSLCLKTSDNTTNWLYWNKNCKLHNTWNKNYIILQIWNYINLNT